MSFKVIGHINPDTDTICSPLAYVWFLSEKTGKTAIAYRAGELNKETTYLLEKFHISTPPVLEKFSAGDEVVIMDTNNPEELLDGIEDARVVEIVDHHKLTGGLHTDEPIPVTIEPIACTATIVWHIMKRAGVTDIPQDIAGIMLGCILSDTLKYTSPTTTDSDKAAAEELAKICGANVDTLAEEMFAAKSDLTGMSTEDILTVDSKVFPMGSKKVRISVLETTKPENALGKLTDLKSTMLSMKSAEQLDHMFFFVVDILKTEAVLVVTTDTEKALAEKAFGVQFTGETVNLPGVVSRKKQMIPKLEPIIG